MVQYFWLDTTVYACSWLVGCGLMTCTAWCSTILSPERGVRASPYSLVFSKPVITIGQHNLRLQLIGWLRSDDLYSMVQYYPQPSERSTVQISPYSLVCSKSVFPIGKHNLRLQLIGRLRSDDLYSIVRYYPQPSERSTDLTVQSRLLQASISYWSTHLMLAADW
jgi:hypothetical protein